MKSRSQGGGKSWDRWYETRNRRLLEISGELPKNLCQDEMKLTVICRYTQCLMENKRVLKYLTKYHPVALRRLNELVGEFDRIVHNGT